MSPILADQDWPPAVSNHLMTDTKITTSFHRARAAGASHQEAFQAALVAYLEKHPEVPSDKAAEIVDGLIETPRRPPGDRI